MNITRNFRILFSQSELFGSTKWRCT